MTNQVRYISLENQDTGQRIDNFLIKQLKGVPKSHIYRLLRKGQIRLNKKRCKPEQRLQEGDLLRLPPLRLANKNATLPLPSHIVSELENAIEYEDKSLLILNKPSGISVHGGSQSVWGIIEILKQGFPHAQNWELAHRLDKETSGCLIIAKQRSILRELHELLRTGEIEKRYLALLEGEWRGNSRYVAMKLRKNVDISGERKVIVSKSGKVSRSYFRPILRFKHATLMEITLDTGRMHQIRVQAAELGHPVAGDTKYGTKEFNQFMRKLGCKRLFLHASAVSFVLPSQNRQINVSIDLDDELLHVLDNR